MLQEFRYFLPTEQDKGLISQAFMFGSPNENRTRAVAVRGQQHWFDSTAWQGWTRLGKAKQTSIFKAIKTEKWKIDVQAKRGKIGVKFGVNGDRSE